MAAVSPKQEQVERELRAQIATLVAQIARLSDQLARSNDRIDELLAIVGRDAKRRRGQTGEKPPEPPPHLDDEAREAFLNRPKPPKLKSKQKRPPKKRSSAGRNKLPESLPRDEHDIAPASCPDCGSEDLVAIRQHVEEKLHVVRSHQRVRRTVRTTCECNACCKRITPPALPSPFSRSKATCAWLAWFIWMRHSLLVPMDRIRRDLEAKGVPLAMSYLVSRWR
jgi:transposase